MFEVNTKEEEEQYCLPIISHLPTQCSNTTDSFAVQQSVLLTNSESHSPTAILCPIKVSKVAIPKKLQVQEILVCWDK